MREPGPVFACHAGSGQPVTSRPKLGCGLLTRRCLLGEWRLFWTSREGTGGPHELHVFEPGYQRPPRPLRLVAEQNSGPPGPTDRTPGTNGGSSTTVSSTAPTSDMVSPVGPPFLPGGSCPEVRPLPPTRQSARTCSRDQCQATNRERSGHRVSRAPLSVTPFGEYRGGCLRERSCILRSVGLRRAHVEVMRA